MTSVLVALTFGNRICVEVDETHRLRAQSSRDLGLDRDTETTVPATETQLLSSGCEVFADIVRPDLQLPVLGNEMRTSVKYVIGIVSYCRHRYSHEVFAE